MHYQDYALEANVTILGAYDAEDPRKAFIVAAVNSKPSQCNYSVEQVCSIKLTKLLKIGKKLRNP